MCGQALLELVHSPHGANRVHGENDYGAHLDDELDEIGPEYGPHPSAGRIRNSDDEANPDRDDFPGNSASENTDVAEPERDREDLDHRLGHPAQDDEVDRDGE